MILRVDHSFKGILELKSWSDIPWRTHWNFSSLLFCFSYVFHPGFALFRYRCCISSLSSTMLNVQGSPWPDEQRTETQFWPHGRRRRCSRNKQMDGSPIFPRKATYRNALIGMGILYYHQPAKYLAESSSTEYRPRDMENLHQQNTDHALRKSNQGSGEGEGLQSDLYLQEYPGASQRVQCHHVHPFCEKTFESVHGDSLRHPPPP